MILAQDEGTDEPWLRQRPQWCSNFEAGKGRKSSQLVCMISLIDYYSLPPKESTMKGVEGRWGSWLISQLATKRDN